MSFDLRRVWEHYFSPLGLWSYMQKQLVDLVNFPEIDRKEDFMNKLDRFHLGAWLQE